MGVEVGTACSSNVDEARVVEGMIEGTVRQHHGQVIYGQLEKSSNIVSKKWWKFELRWDSIWQGDVVQFWTYLKSKPVWFVEEFVVGRRWKSQGQLWEFGIQDCKSSSLNPLDPKGRHIILVSQLIDRSPALTTGEEAPRCRGSLPWVLCCLVYVWPYTLLTCVDNYKGCITPIPLYSGFLLQLISERHLQAPREEGRVFMALLQPDWVWGVTAFLHQVHNSFGQLSWFSTYHSLPSR